MRLINDLWKESNFGIPEWEFELQKIKKSTKRYFIKLILQWTRWPH